jgi:hypothetical protein
LGFYIFIYSDNFLSYKLNLVNNNLQGSESFTSAVLEENLGIGQLKTLVVNRVSHLLE